MRLEELARLVSAARFLSGFLTMALHAVCRDLAALESLIAEDIVVRSTLAIADILRRVNLYFTIERIGVCTCEDQLLGELSPAPWLPTL